MNNVPFLDLATQHESLSTEIEAAISGVLASSAFSGGRYVSRFEEEFADFCGTSFAVGVGSGTEALWLALLALDIGRGDEVITVPMTFLATLEAISMAGAAPVLVDVRPDTGTLDPELLENAITSRTRAIMPVHLYGRTADMDPIREIADRHGLAVIEDACQAHGAEYHGRRAGSLGDAAGFSFYPGKNLGALGEAGAVTTDREDLAVTMRRLRDHGQREKYYHDLVGWNARMDGLQGAVLSVKLRRLDSWNEQRRNRAALYRELLSDVEGIELHAPEQGKEHVHHLFTVLSPERDRIREYLGDRGIQTGIHYPIPCHLQEAYRHLGHGEGDFPVSERIGRETFSLPMFPELREEQVRRVAEEIRSFAGARVS